MLANGRDLEQLLLQTRNIQKRVQREETINDSKDMAIADCHRIDQRCLCHQKMTIHILVVKPRVEISAPFNSLEIPSISFEV